jgi:hypothetical protein
VFPPLKGAQGDVKIIRKDIINELILNMLTTDIQLALKWAKVDVKASK